MYPEGIVNTSIPEWYTIERDSEKAIRNLVSVRDLTFYLTNPDEYIRRLAILRLNELKLRDSVNLLIEILENHLESQMNRELAAWTIKTVSLKHDIDLYISSSLLNKFTGSEKYSDIFKISVIDSTLEIKMAISHSPLESELNTEHENIRHFEDISFDAAFPASTWFREFLRQATKGTVSFILKTPLILGCGLKKLSSVILPVLSKLAVAFCWLVQLPGLIFRWIFSNISRILSVRKKLPKLKKTRSTRQASYTAQIARTPHTVQTTYTSSNIQTTQSIQPAQVPSASCAAEDPSASYAARPRYTAPQTEYPAYAGILSAYKKPKRTVQMNEIIVNILYYLFTPLRLIIKKRTFTAAMLLPIYIFLAFTNTGNILTYKYFGFDLREVQLDAFYSAKEFLTYAISEVEDLTGISYAGSAYIKDTGLPLGENNPENNSRSNNGMEKQFKVIAKKGLNLRDEPSGNAKKVAEQAIPYNSIVYYLMNSQKDKGGKEWYRIRLEDGRTGWVYSKYLEEAGNSLN